MCCTITSFCHPCDSVFLLQQFWLICQQFMCHQLYLLSLSLAFALSLSLLSWFRDGPDTSSPQLGVFSGNTALESAYSTSLKVLIHFHSDFSTGGFFILNFHGTDTHLNEFICTHTHTHLEKYKLTGTETDMLYLFHARS